MPSKPNVVIVIPEEPFLDFTKTSPEIVVQQINHDNACDPPLKVKDLEFGHPEVIPDLTSILNTRLMVNVAKHATMTFEGEQEITYRRVDLSEIVGDSGDPSFEQRGRQRVSELIPEINARYQINLGPDDYYDAPLPSFSRSFDSELPFQVRAKPGSLVWTGRANLILTPGI